MFEFMSVAKALTDENRVRILVALLKRELCVCQITAFIDLAPSTTSKHLAVLRQARLIESKKRGKWVYYSAATRDTVPALIADALAFVQRSTEHADIIRNDERKINEIIQREQEMLAADPTCAAEYHSADLHALSDAGSGTELAESGEGYEKRAI